MTSVKGVLILIAIAGGLCVLVWTCIIPKILGEISTIRKEFDSEMKSFWVTSNDIWSEIMTINSGENMRPNRQAAVQILHSLQYHNVAPRSAEEGAPEKGYRVKRKRLRVLKGSAERGDNKFLSRDFLPPISGQVDQPYLVGNSIGAPPGQEAQPPAVGPPGSSPSQQPQPPSQEPQPPSQRPEPPSQQPESPGGQNGAGITVGSVPLQRQLC